MTTIGWHDRANAVLAVAATHRERILAALAHLDGQIPQTGGGLASASYETVASAELLTSRFGKLQDHLSTQVVPLALQLTGEPMPQTCTFVDRLLRLEQLGAISSVAEFRRLREIRNDLAHDYPDDPDEAVAGLHQVVAAVPALLGLEQRLRAHMVATLAKLG